MEKHVNTYICMCRLCSCDRCHERGNDKGVRTERDDEKGNARDGNECVTRYEMYLCLVCTSDIFLYWGDVGEVLRLIYVP